MQDLTVSVKTGAPVAAADATQAIQVEPVLSREQWERLVAAAPFPHLPQSWAYGAGKAATGWHAVRVAFHVGGQPVAFATVLEKRVLGLRVLARVNRGPVFLSAVPSRQRIEAVYRALRRAWPGPLLIAPALPHGEPSAALLRAAGFRLRHDRGWSSGRIDLDRDTDAIWAGFSSVFRNRYRHAAKAGAELRVLEGWEGFEWMIARHEENMAEKRFSAVDGRFLRTLCDTSAADITVFQLLEQRRPVAGMSVVRSGSMAEYHVGWFGEAGRRLNAGNFLMWSIMREMKRRGATSFDVGGLAPGSGYTRFKRTMKPVEYRLAGEWMSF